MQKFIQDAITTLELLENQPKFLKPHERKEYQDIIRNGAALAVNLEKSEELLNGWQNQDGSVRAGSIVSPEKAAEILESAVGADSPLGVLLAQKEQALKDTKALEQRTKSKHKLPKIKSEVDSLEKTNSAMMRFIEKTSESFHTQFEKNVIDTLHSQVGNQRAGLSRTFSDYSSSGLWAIGAWQGKGMQDLILSGNEPVAREFIDAIRDENLVRELNSKYPGGFDRGSDESLSPKAQSINQRHSGLWANCYNSNPVNNLGDRSYIIAYASSLALESVVKSEELTPDEIGELSKIAAPNSLISREKLLEATVDDLYDKIEARFPETITLGVPIKEVDLSEEPTAGRASTRKLMEQASTSSTPSIPPPDKPLTTPKL